MKSIIDDETLAKMAQSRVNARMDRVIYLAQQPESELRALAETAGLDYDDFSGDLVALIETIVTAEYPQLISVAPEVSDYVSSEDEVSMWFQAGVDSVREEENALADLQQAGQAAQASFRLTPQPMTAEYADLGSDPIMDLFEEVKILLAGVSRVITQGDNWMGAQLIKEFATSHGLTEEDFVKYNFPEESPVPVIPTWSIQDRITRALGGILDLGTRDTLTSYLTRPHMFDQGSDQNAVGISDVHRLLTGVVSPAAVSRALRQYMEGHWSTGTIRELMGVALSTSPYFEGERPSPASSWPQAGPQAGAVADEPTQITPIIETGETDPTSEQPSYYDLRQ